MHSATMTDGRASDGRARLLAEGAVGRCSTVEVATAPHPQPDGPRSAVAWSASQCEENLFKDCKKRKIKVCFYQVVGADKLGGLCQ